MTNRVSPFDELESYWETVKNTNDQSVNDLIAVNGTNLICYNAIKHSICIYNIKTNKWINEIKIEIDDYIDPSSYVYPIEDYEIWESLMDLVMIKNKVFFYLDIPTSDGRWEAALFCTDIITETTRKIEGISRVASRVFSLDDTYFYVCIEDKYYVWLLEDMHFIDMIELNVDLSNCDIVNMGGRVVAINDKSGDVYEIKKDKDGSLCCSDVIFKIQMDNVQALCGISDTLLAVYYDDLEEELAYIEIKEFSDKETKETGTVRDR